MTLTATPTTDAPTTAPGDAVIDDAIPTPDGFHAVDPAPDAVEPGEAAADPVVDEAATDGPPKGDGHSPDESAASSPDVEVVGVIDPQGHAVAADDDGAASSPVSTAPRPARAPADGAAATRQPRARSGGRPPAPRGFPRADRPGIVPTPEHHHLPGWVRRDFARSRPALADLLGLLQGGERAAFESKVAELTSGISAGKFSLAWQYPALIEEGRALYEGQREHIAEMQRVARELERTRRNAGDRLRDAGDLLGADALTRLQRSLRAAGSAAAIAEVDAEVEKALAGARGTAGKRRQREIERTRKSILRTLPPSAAAAEEPGETWQDVLRRFAEQQAGGGS